MTLAVLGTLDELGIRPKMITGTSIDRRLLIDGGSVNPVPFDLLREDCDIVFAVDVLGQRLARKLTALLEKG